MVPFQHSRFPAFLLADDREKLRADVWTRLFRVARLPGWLNDKLKSHGGGVEAGGSPFLFETDMFICSCMVCKDAVSSQVPSSTGSVPYGIYSLRHSRGHEAAGRWAKMWEAEAQ